MRTRRAYRSEMDRFRQAMDKPGHQVSALVRPNPDGLAQRILEESEAAKLIDQAPPGRDRLLLRLLYMSGIRVSELAQLKWCDLMPRAEAGRYLHARPTESSSLYLPE